MTDLDLMANNTLLDFYSRFLSNSVEEVLTQAGNSPIETHLFDLVSRTVAHVPAYREFLISQGLRPDVITTQNDFAHLPLMTKDNYIRAFPLSARCCNGTLSTSEIFAVSSGSTGQPTLWPRNVQDELVVAYEFERILKWNFDAHKRSTLAVICFALGTWVGGLYTTAICRYLAQKGLPVSVIAPGNNVTEILRVIPELGRQFEQVILFGYPPFVKTILDSGMASGIRWADYNVKMVYAGEVFSEAWRTLVTGRVGGTDILRTSATLYGTADAGVLGAETPLSIAIRRYLAERPEIAQSLFGEARLPTLVQYNPRSRFFETNGETLVVTCDGTVPLIRYHIADKGGLITFDNMMAGLRRMGCEPSVEFSESFSSCPVALPFVYVFGRADFTVSYFGANIFPENIAVGLEQPEFENSITGKFVLEVRETRMGDSELHLAVELLPGMEEQKNLASALSESVRIQVIRINSEFAHYVPTSHQLPKVVLRPYGDPEWFPLGVKHRYTRKQNA